MSEREDEVAFDGVSEVLGADVFLSDGSVERLTREQLEQPLFPDEGEGLEASAGQFLAEYYRQTGTSAQDQVTRAMLDEALRSGSATGRTSLTVRIDSPSIQFRRGAELVNFDRLVFDVELTVRKHLNS